MSGATRDERRDAAAERLDVVERQVVRDAAGHRDDSRRLGLPRQDDHEVRPEERELARDVASRPLAEARQEEDRGDPDRDAEERERRPEAVPAERPGGEGEEVALPSRRRVPHDAAVGEPHLPRRARPDRRGRASRRGA